MQVWHDAGVRGMVRGQWHDTDAIKELTTGADTRTEAPVVVTHRAAASKAAGRLTSQAAAAESTTQPAAATYEEALTTGGLAAGELPRRI